MAAKKEAEDQPVVARTPRQARSREKVQLMLEAATRILEKEGLGGLTTNAVAAKAGVSIGTLYQYFPNKAAILDALADREMADMSARVMAVMADPSIATTQDRVTAVVGAVAASYGERREAHRLVMAHSLSRGGDRLTPLLSRLRQHLTARRTSGAFTAPLDPADAFVLTNAFAGVLRAMVGQATVPARADIERSLTRLLLGFLS